MQLHTGQACLRGIVAGGDNPKTPYSGCRGNNKSRSKDAVETKKEAKSLLRAKRVQEEVELAGEGFSSPKKAVSAHFSFFLVSYGP